MATTNDVMLSNAASPVATSVSVVDDTIVVVSDSHVVPAPYLPVDPSQESHTPKKERFIDKFIPTFKVTHQLSPELAAKTDEIKASLTEVKLLAGKFTDFATTSKDGLVSSANDALSRLASHTDSLSTSAHSLLTDASAQVRTLTDEFKKLFTTVSTAVAISNGISILETVINIVITIIAILRAETNEMRFYIVSLMFTGHHLLSRSVIKIDDILANTNALKQVLTQSDTLEPVAHGLEDDVHESFLQMLTRLMKHLVTGDATEIKKDITRAKNLSTIASFVKHSKDMVNYLFSACKYALEIVYETVTGVPYELTDESELIDSVNSVLAFYNSLIKAQDTNKSAADVHAFQQCIKLMPTIEYIDAILIDRKNINWLSYTRARNYIMNFFEQSKIALCKGVDRPRPVVIALWGLPGSGKSNLSKLLMCDFCSMVLKIPYDETCYYDKKPDTEHWEKYRGQSITHFDDYWQIDDQKIMQKEYMEVISCANDAPYPLNMAFEGKGAVFFTSKMLLVTSNLDRTEVLKVANKGAIERRWDFYVTVKIKEGIQAEQLEDIKDDIYELWLGNRANPYREQVNYAQLLARISDLYLARNKKRQTFAETLTARSNRNLQITTPNMKPAQMLDELIKRSTPPEKLLSEPHAQMKSDYLPMNHKNVTKHLIYPTFTIGGDDNITLFPFDSRTFVSLEVNDLYLSCVLATGTWEEVQNFMRLYHNLISVLPLEFFLSNPNPFPVYIFYFERTKEEYDAHPDTHASIFDPATILLARTALRLSSFMPYAVAQLRSDTESETESESDSDSDTTQISETLTVTLVPEKTTQVISSYTQLGVSCTNFSAQVLPDNDPQYHLAKGVWCRGNYRTLRICMKFDKYTVVRINTQNHIFGNSKEYENTSFTPVYNSARFELSLALVAPNGSRSYKIIKLNSAAPFFEGMEMVIDCAVRIDYGPCPLGITARTKGVCLELHLHRFEGDVRRTITLPIQRIHASRAFTRLIRCGDLIKTQAPDPFAQMFSFLRSDPVTPDAPTVADKTKYEFENNTIPLITTFRDNKAILIAAIIGCLSIATAGIALYKILHTQQDPIAEADAYNVGARPVYVKDRASVALNRMQWKKATAQADPNAENLANVVTNNNGILRLSTGTGSNFNTGVTFLEDRSFIIPTHAAVVLLDPKITTRSLTLYRDQTVYNIEKFDVFDYPDHDLSIVVLKDGRLPMFRDITSHLIPERDIPNVTRGSIALIKRSVDGIPYIIQASEINRVASVSYRRNAHSQDRVFTTDVLELKGNNVDPQLGECGYMYVAINTALQQKLVGMHVGGAKRLAYCQILTKEMYAQFKEFMTAADPIANMAASISVPEEIEQTKIPKEQVMHPPRKSEIVPSLVHGEIYGPPSRSPAALKPAKGVSPFTNALKKTIRPDTSVPPHREPFLDAALDKIFTEIPLLVTPETINIFEAVNKPVGYDHIEPLHFSTSAGWPHNVTEEEPGKRPFLSEDPITKAKIPKPLLLDLTELLIEMLLDDNKWEQVKIVFCDFLKDELRPNHKVESLSTRLVSAGTIECLTLMRILFSSFVENCIKGHNESFFAVGTNPHSIEWKFMYDYLSRNDKASLDKILAGDIEKLDASTSSQIQKKIIAKIVEWHASEYQGPVAVLPGLTLTFAQRQTLRFRILSLVFTNRYHVAFDTMYHMTHGNPSGNFLTTIFNCIVTATAILYCMLVYVNEFLHLNLSVDEIWLLIAMKIFGDDHLVFLFGILRQVINMGVLAHLMLDLGLVYVDFLKDSISINKEVKDGKTVLSADPAHYRLEQVYFLKRKIEPKDSSVVLAPLDEQVVKDTVSWTHSNLPLDEGTHLSCDNALSEFFHFGRARYLQELKTINLALKKKGLQPCRNQFEKLYAQFFGLRYNVFEEKEEDPIAQMFSSDDAEDLTPAPVVPCTKETAFPSQTPAPPAPDMDNIDVPTNLTRRLADGRDVDVVKTIYVGTQGQFDCSMVSSNIFFLMQYDPVFGYGSHFSIFVTSDEEKYLAMYRKDLRPSLLCNPDILVHYNYEIQELLEALRSLDLRFLPSDIDYLLNFPLAERVCLRTEREVNAANFFFDITSGALHRLEGGYDLSKVILHVNDHINEEEYGDPYFFCLSYKTCSHKACGYLRRDKLFKHTDVQPLIRGPHFWDRLSTIEADVEPFAQMNSEILGSLKSEASSTASKPVSSIAKKISTIAFKLSSFPIIGDIASKVAPVSTAIADVAEAIGLDKPTYQASHQLNKLELTSDLAGVKGTDVSQPLGADPNNLVTNDPSVFAEKRNYNLFSNYKLLPALILFNGFDSTALQNAIVFQIPVTPAYVSPSFLADNYPLVPSVNLASMFRYWRGGMKYRFTFVCSKFISARVRIEWYPDPSAVGSLTNSNIGDIVSLTVDINGDTECCFSIPYLRELMYLPVADPFNASQSSSSFWYGGSNGVIVLRVVAPPVVSNSVADTEIDVNVWSSCAEDTEFARPTNFWKSYTYSTVSNVPPMSNEPHAQMAETQSSARDMFSKVFKPLAPSTFSRVANVLQGENISSFTEYGHRYSIVHRETTAAGSFTFTQYQAFIDSFGATEGDAYYNRLVNMFQFHRGNIRYRVLDEDNEPNTMWNAYNYSVNPTVTPENIEMTFPVASGAHMQLGSIRPIIEVEVPMYGVYPFYCYAYDTELNEYPALGIKATEADGTNRVHHLSYFVACGDNYSVGWPICPGYAIYSPSSKLDPIAQMDSSHGNEDRLVVQTSVQETQQLTSFRDTVGVSGEDVAPVTKTPIFATADPYPDQGLKEVLSRQYLIKSVTYSGTAAQGSVLTTLRFPDDLFALLSIQDKLVRFKYLSAGVHIEFRLNATTFHAGRLLITSYPHCGLGGQIPGTLFDEDMQAMSMLPSIELSAMSNQTVTLDLPYIASTAFIDLPNFLSYPGFIGSVFVYVLNKLRLVGSTSTPALTLNIYANFTDPHVAGPTLAPIALRKEVALLKEPILKGCPVPKTEISKNTRRNRKVSANIKK